MIDEVEGPRKERPKGPNFEAMSVEELEEHLKGLRAEQKRLEDAIEEKKAYLTKAGSLFANPGSEDK